MNNGAFRSITVSNLMYIKEDLVLPNNLSFYDLIISKARGKSGPLFHFDVYDDIRLEHNANVEKEESHAGQILTTSSFALFICEQDVSSQSFAICSLYVMARVDSMTHAWGRPCTSSIQEESLAPYKIMLVCAA